MRGDRTSDGRGDPEPSDAELVTMLRDGDEDAFGRLVARHQPVLIRLAMRYVPNRATAEEIAQDTWVGFLRGLGRFEGRASVQTWLYRILVNRARTAGVREHRQIPVSEFAQAGGGRFASIGRWEPAPAHWSDGVDDRLSAAALAARVRQLISELPDDQRRVITLRDVQGVTSTDACAAMEIDEPAQRLLLHRARVRVRVRLAAEFDVWGLS